MVFWRRNSRQMQAATEQVAVAPDASPARPAKPRAGIMRQYDLIERVRRYNPNTDEALLNRAYVYAMKAHGEQKRASGDPYFSHPLEVAAILTDHKLDDATIVAALLHDTIEDTETTREELARAFSDRVASLVVECTDDMRLPKAERRRRQIVDGPHKSPSAKLIKIADKISNIGARVHPDPSAEERDDLVDYTDWAEQVVAGCRGGNVWLDKTFDKTVAKARSSL